ncbi:WD-40 repeat-containing protein [Nodularia sp. NIES-3585]|nr:WD-40 repeat-containing protein [Nodularia sp. NIES-3585]
MALQESRWRDARQLAETALQILNDISSLAPYELSLYQFLLARADQGLGEVTAAIEHLQIAKTASKPQYDPQLYISILERLRLLYFDKTEYRLAFNLKQEQLQIEHQYGFRAFVGASYLNPQRQAINPAQLQVENTDSVAQEIAASGRSQDVTRLRDRISGTEHKLTVIHGQSGVGKSSILQGGLIPTLQQQPIEGRNVLPILLRVYTDWVGMLGQCLKANIQSLNASSLNSPGAIEAELRNNADRNLLTVLIFDQFEEFFFVYPDQGDRRSFYEFLHICLDIPFVKVILSLREDYLHYLLELERLFDLKVINNNILAKNIRYYLGNFSPEDAKTVIQTLTQQNLSPNLSLTRREAMNYGLTDVGLEGVIAEETRNQSSLEAALIEQLVQDLAVKIGEVRPIELQLVGMQLQTKKITTLKQYQDFGTKENLVEGFLESVIKDCGAENERAARLILYLLTDENGTRPLKTRAELTAKLAAETDRLDLILDIFVQSGLVLLLPESPADRYQLVHDYLVSFIRQQQGNEILAKLALAEEQLKQEQEAKQILAVANQEAEAKIREGQKRFKISSRLSVFLLVVSGIASVYAVIQVGTASKANENQQQAERKLTKTEDDYRRTIQSLEETERKQAQLALFYASGKRKIR